MIGRSPRFTGRQVRATALLLACACVGAQSAAAQEEASQGAIDSREVERRLRERNRSELNPFEPMAISGLEQNGNDLRSRTPALLKSDRNSAQVDQAENYGRMIEMYEMASVFHSPLPTVNVANVEPPPRPRPSSIEVEPSTRSFGSWVAGVLVAALSIVLWRLWRARLPVSTKRTG